MLPLHLLSVFFCAVLVSGGHSSSQESGEEEQGLCLNCMEVTMLCLKDTALGAKLAPAFSQCTEDPAAAARMPGGKGKQPDGKDKQPPPPPFCPTFNQTMAMLKVRF
jgi:hypothetical protein